MRFKYTVCMLANMHSTIVRFAFSLVLMFLFVPAAAFAVSLPAARDIVVVPGATESVEIPIANSGSTDADFSLLLLSASFREGVEQPQLRELPSELASWISLSESFLSVPSGTSVPVTFSIHPSEDAPPQTFVLALVATEKLEGEITLIHGSATLVFVSVGDVLPLGSCVLFLRDDPGTANLSLSNSGRGILYDDGEIVLRGIFGIRLGSAPSNPMLHRIPPEQTRTWQVALPPIPWWAVGPLSYSVDDVQLNTHPCAGVDAGARWFPLFAIGIVVFGAATMFIRRRTA